MSKKPIHNLDTLDKEIYRLKLKQKDLESDIRRGISKLRKQGLLRVFGSALFGKKKATEDKENIFSSFTRNEKLNRFLGRLTEDLTGRFGDHFDDFMDRIFRKKRH